MHTANGSPHCFDSMQSDHCGHFLWTEQHSFCLCGHCFFLCMRFCVPNMWISMEEPTKIGTNMPLTITIDADSNTFLHTKICALWWMNCKPEYFCKQNNFWKFLFLWNALAFRKFCLHLQGVKHYQKYHSILLVLLLIIIIIIHIYDMNSVHKP